MLKELKSKGTTEEKTGSFFSTIGEIASRVGKFLTTPNMIEVSNIFYTNGYNLRLVEGINIILKEHQVRLSKQELQILEENSRDYLFGLILEGNILDDKLFENFCSSLSDNQDVSSSILNEIKNEIEAISSLIEKYMPYENNFFQ